MEISEEHKGNEGRISYSNVFEINRSHFLRYYLVLSLIDQIFLSFLVLYKQHLSFDLGEKIIFHQLRIFNLCRRK